MMRTKKYEINYFTIKDCKVKVENGKFERRDVIEFTAKLDTGAIQKRIVKHGSRC